uniref:Uncharacterized protein LOC104228116 n=1 Tax=Nicotiana sylvestris TaxID=4096 RepID=A0A1U7WJJ1_NICSY|nr:PREDICTED: uncharacterized protein LOC104228116 [Nicotiana sylvestris]
MNRDNKQKDEAGTPSKKRKAESSKLEGESATKYQRSSEQPTIRCKLTPQEKYELEKFLADAWNNLMNLGKKNKDEIESEQVDSNGTHSSSNLPGDPIHSPQLFPGGNTGSSANVDGRELLVQKEVYKGKEVAKAVNSEDNSGKGVIPMPPLFQEMVAQKEVDKEAEFVHGNVDENGEAKEVNQQKMKIFGHWIIKE